MSSLPPATTGSLASKPLAHLLAYLLDKELSGSLVLTRPVPVGGVRKLPKDAEVATIVFAGGEVAKIRTTVPIVYLGIVLYELGFIDNAELDTSLRELAEAKRPHGEVLLGRGSITKKQLKAGLAEQTLRKLSHLFSLGGDASFMFRGEIDLLSSYGGRYPVLVDPLPAIWRGILEFASIPHLRDAIARIGASRCRLNLGAQFERFHFEPAELAVVESLRIKALSLEEIHALRVLPANRTELLVYCLLITKQVALVTSMVESPKPALSPPGPGPATWASATGTPRVAPRISSGSPPSPFARSGTTSPPGPVSVAGQPPRPSGTPAQSSSSSYRLRAVSVATKRTTRAAVLPEAELSARAQMIHARASSIQGEDFFQRLSLPRDATVAQVEQAFWAFASLWNASDLPPELDGAREDCARVFLALAEAHATLTDLRKRGAYLHGLVLPPSHDLARDLTASGAKNEADGAKACLAKNDLDRAERLARQAHRSKPHDAGALALLAWVEAQRPSNQSVEATRVRIVMLDRAICLEPECEEALYYRSQLHKRTLNHRAAMKDLARIVALNPDNVEADRELRIYEMRVRLGSITMNAVRVSAPAGDARAKAATPARALFERVIKK